MRLVTVKTNKLKNYTQDTEFLHCAKRPCVLIIKLKYKNQRIHFAVPMRSNIPGSAPKNQYFPLPPRFKTKPGNRHGIHYIKMFPVRMDVLDVYHTEGNEFSTLCKSIINQNEKKIIKECQEYLHRYEDGDIPRFATNIDFLLRAMNEE